MGRLSFEQQQQRKKKDGPSLRPAFLDRSTMQKEIKTRVSMIRTSFIAPLVCDSSCLRWRPLARAAIYLGRIFYFYDLVRFCEQDVTASFGGRFILPN